MKVVLVSFCVLFCMVCYSQVLKEDSRLMDKPSGAPVGSAIATGTPVKIIERQGFWVHVEVSGRNGWMKASGLSFTSGGNKVTAIDTGRLGSGNIVSTAATRGLSAKDLLNGTPRTDEVAKMSQFQPDQSSIKEFIAQGNVIALAGSPVLRMVSPQSAMSAASSSSAVKSSDVTPAKSSVKKDSDEW